MLVVVIAVCFAVYAIVSAFAEEIRHMPGKEDAEGFKVDELRIKKVDEADALLFGDSLARELKMDTLVHTVTGEHHNVYRPPKKSKSDLMDGREWNGLFKNLRRWFKANKGDPKLIIFLVLFGLGIISLAGYGIWKRKHPHGREDY